MRFWPGLMLLLPLASPFAHAELIDEVNDRGELRIALSADLPPFSFKQDDRLTGFDVELGELLAKELEVKPSFLVTDQDDLLSGVESGKYDVAITPVVMPRGVEDRFDFTEPYSDTASQPTVSLAIPLQKGNPAFQASLNNALQRIKADGRLAALSQKWLEREALQP